MHKAKSSSKAVEHSGIPLQNKKVGKHSGPCVPLPQLKDPSEQPEEKINQSSGGT